MNTRIEGLRHRFLKTGSLAAQNELSFEMMKEQLRFDNVMAYKDAVGFGVNGTEYQLPDTFARADHIHGSGLHNAKCSYCGRKLTDNDVCEHCGAPA
jgi:hypothetical protein